MDAANSNLPRRRTALVASELARYNIDIAALSETRLPDNGTLIEEGEGYTFFWQGLPSEENRIHGVGFAIRSPLLKGIPSTPIGISERLMTWRVPLAKTRYATLLSVYAPTQTSDPLVKEQFYQCLSEQLRRIPTNDKIILAGDLNARVGTSYHLWDKVLGRHGVGQCNTNGLRLLSLCAEHELALTNTMFQLRNMHKTTWMHPRSRHWHMIDYIIVRQRDLDDVRITRVMRGADCSTDHRMVRSEISMRVRPPIRRRAAAPSINLSLLKNPNTRDN